MVRIAYVNETMQNGGTEQHIALLCKNLDRTRFSPIVYCLAKEGPFADKLREAGVPVVLLAGGKVQAIKYLMRRWLRWSDITIVQSNSTSEAIDSDYQPQVSRFRRLVGGLSAWVTEFASFWDMIFRLKRDRIDLISAHMYGVRCGLLAASFVGKPAIYTQHDIIDEHYYSQIEIWLLRRLVPGAFSVIAVSEQTKLSIVERLGISTDSVIVIGHAADLPEIPEPSIVRKEKIHFFKVGTIGNLVSRKGHRYMLEAVQVLVGYFPGFKYIIAGDGSMRRWLETEAKRLGVSEFVQFIGSYQNVDLPSLLADWDLVVIPSISEALGIVALEAMSCGKPIVASAVGGLPEIIKDEETGILVPPCDPDALACAVRRLLEDDPLRQRMAQAAWKHAHDFTPERVVAETVRVYESALQKASAI